MKKFILTLITFGSLTAFSQGGFGKLKKLAGNDSSSSSGGLLQNISGKLGGGGTASLSNDEIISGLKEALSTGTVNSTHLLNKADGYFANEAIKILMPEEAQKAEKTLRSMGMGSLVDKAILSMNRAAEDAAGNVSGIFINAIKKMTVQDGLQILRGGDFAATEYLKKMTTTELTEQMRPVIESSLAKVNATAYWKDVFNQYNRFSPNKVNPDLSAYVTERALQGLFHTISLEEQKIRKDPSARVTDLLKKVFSS